MILLIYGYEFHVIMLLFLYSAIAFMIKVLRASIPVSGFLGSALKIITVGVLSLGFRGLSGRIYRLVI